MKMYGGVEVQLQTFVTLALNRGEQLASCPGHSTPRERVPDFLWTRGWVGPRASLDTVKKVVT